MEREAIGKPRREESAPAEARVMLEPAAHLGIALLLAVSAGYSVSKGWYGWATFLALQVITQSAWAVVNTLRERAP